MAYWSREGDAIGDREDFLLDEADKWAAEGLITPEQAMRLRERYTKPAVDFRRRVIVRAALATGGLLLLLGTFRLLADLRLGSGMLTVIQGALAIACFAWGQRLHRARPEARSGPALIYLAAMFYLGAIGLAGYTFEVLDRQNAPWLLLAGGAVTGALGWWLRFLKLHALGVFLVAVAAGIWLHRAGMPVRFAALAVAAAVTAAGAALKPRPDFRLTYVMGGVVAGAFALLACEVSVEGAWRLLYAALFTGWAALPLSLGMREGDDALAGLGILLLVLDVYTQYYVLFWDWAPRTVFFLVAGGITLGFGIAYERLLHGTRPSALAERLEGRGPDQERR